MASAASAFRGALALSLVAAALAQQNGTTTFGCAYVARSGGLAACVSNDPASGCCNGTQTAFASATFSDGMELQSAGGWAQLYVRVHSGAGELAQARAAGFIEGYMTMARSLQFIRNVHGGTSTFSPALSAFVRENLDYVQARVAGEPGDPYWRHLGLVHAQQASGYEGFAAAARAVGADELDSETYYAATLIGDMDDLCVVFGCKRTVSWRRARAAAAARDAANAPVHVDDGFFDEDDGTIRYERYLSDGHCSALVKPLGALEAPSDVLFAHTTWNPLETMQRIYKVYDFPFTTSGVPGSSVVPGAVVSFASYPAVFYSFDDYYTIAPSALAVLETTIINNNASLWSLVKPQSVMDWARNMVANRLADDGQSWAAYFQRDNSGTYNNMFLVLSYLSVKAAVAERTPLPAGTLVVVEQMPGIVVITDATFHLQPGGEGYYASYNRIQTPWLFNLTNQTALVAAYGDHYTYELYSRAQIMRERHSSVVDNATFLALLRYNAFESDPLGLQGCTAPSRSASNAISERGDLSPVSGCVTPGLGLVDESGIDVKMTSLGLMTSGGPTVSVVQSGPTAFAPRTPFTWSTSPFASLPHEGQPDTFDFDFVALAPGYPLTGPLRDVVGTRQFY